MATERATGCAVSWRGVPLHGRVERLGEALLVDTRDFLVRTSESIARLVDPELGEILDNEKVPYRVARFAELTVRGDECCPFDHEHKPTPGPVLRSSRHWRRLDFVPLYKRRSSRPTVRSGVRTNSVCPAPIDTPLLKDFRETMSDKLIDWNVSETNGRLVTPREVATVLAFLGSDAASYVNGVNLLVDAGFTAALTTGQVDFSGLG